MAGAGFKTFNTGDVLTASDVNTYLMQQTVMVFASSAARSTALGANVAEGMLSYLKDTDKVEVYNGSAWVASDDPDAIQNSIVDAKGDLITATAADTPARLASSGINGEVLTVDTSTSTGLKWSAPAASGMSPNLTLLNVGGTTLTGATTVTVNVSSYDYYYIWIWNMSSANASSIFSMRINGDSTTKYGWLKYGTNGTADTNDWYDINQFNRYNLGQMGDTAGDAARVALSLIGGKSSVIKTINHICAADGSGTDDNVSISGNYTGSSAITSFSFLSSTGNFDGGTVYIYGA